MTRLRHLLAHRRWFAAWLVAVALAVRLLVPAGYMPAGTGSLSLMVCPGHAAAVPAMVAMLGMAHHDDNGHDADRHEVDQPCAFAGLAMPSLAAADPLAPPIPTALPLAEPVDERADTRAPPRRAFLRPPLRGPPSLG